MDVFVWAFSWVIWVQTLDGSQQPSRRRPEGGEGEESAR
ncbi:hypothetical protein QG37_03125 [Candidozyma auris]|nr:hypothetical protein QG37_03125 [[Candida] auris]